jgi:ferric-dicitrate binding protein FerR (iron transport regulator)
MSTENNHNEYQDIWELTKAYKPSENKSTDAAWNRIKNEIQQSSSNNNQNSNLSVSYRKWVSIAAAVAMFALGGYFYFLPRTNSNIQTIAIETGSKNGKSISLPDGSEIFLTPNSKVTYSFTEQQRKINLSGEARFEVARNENAPFTVETSNSKITVLGTGFNVRSYSNENTEVFVNHGKVKVETESEEVILVKNEFTTANNSTLSSGTKESTTVQFDDKVYRFQNAPISEVLAVISFQTQKKISINTNTDKLFNGTFSYNESAENMASIIENATGLKVIIE